MKVIERHAEQLAALGHVARLSILREPTALAELRAGEAVLDLGSGGGITAAMASHATMSAVALFNLALALGIFAVPAVRPGYRPLPPKATA